MCLNILNASDSPRTPATRFPTKHSLPLGIACVSANPLSLRPYRTSILTKLGDLCG